MTDEKYMVFAWCTCCGKGGFNDYLCRFDQLEDAIKYVGDLGIDPYEFAHIVFKNEIICEFFVKQNGWELEQAITTIRRCSEKES